MSSTITETCRCGAIFQMSAPVPSLLERETREFRNAHTACRASMAKADPVGPTLARPQAPSPSDLCACGHPRSDHIYHEGACRPGFVCLCGAFQSGGSDDH